MGETVANGWLHEMREVVALFSLSLIIPDVLTHKVASETHTHTHDL